VRAAWSAFQNKSAEQHTLGQVSTTAPASAGGTCARALDALEPSVGAVVYQAQAVFGATPVQVLVYEPAGTTDGPQRLVAFDRASCRVLVDRSF